MPFKTLKRLYLKKWREKRDILKLSYNTHFFMTRNNVEAKNPFFLLKQSQ